MSWRGEKMKSRIFNFFHAVIFTTLVLTLLGGPCGAFSASMNWASTYNSNTTVMDQSLGLTGCTIENFEDGTLVRGMSIKMEGYFGGNLYPYGPITQNPPTFSYGANFWDGGRYLINLPNDSHGHRSNTVFYFSNSIYPYGLSFFGTGLASFYADYSLYVNETLVCSHIAQIPNYTYTADEQRNGYLKITAGPGESIWSVRFKQNVVNTYIEQIALDHIAIRAAPEPATIAMLVLGGMMIRKFKIKS
jgi:hypothetical protein